jgi:hypothetical protein
MYFKSDVIRKLKPNEEDKVVAESDRGAKTIRIGQVEVEFDNLIDPANPQQGTHPVFTRRKGD